MHFEKDTAEEGTPVPWPQRHTRDTETQRLRYRDLQTPARRLQTPTRPITWPSADLNIPSILLLVNRSLRPPVAGHPQTPPGPKADQNWFHMTG
ncbi:hypothetical protein AAFF_G00260440 [Aldrovandia affinis]|uniref:Uncharacterized protein n=1 Tax=Aldrovandia affinis TaxID=143900 RepID=A0AAD7REL1_9TELE|nr:hypothetical protein AAFF_G00260440 [Aldrovandia affinis]